MIDLYLSPDYPHDATLDSIRQWFASGPDDYGRRCEALGRAYVARIPKRAALGLVCIWPMLEGRDVQRCWLSVLAMCEQSSWT